MPPSLPRLRALAALVVLGLTAGCATERAVLPLTSTDLPDHFLVGDLDGTETMEPTPGGACRSPLVDSRDGTRLTIAESSPGVGLYEVPPGRYGVPDGHLLQVDCGTGQALGIVRR